MKDFFECRDLLQQAFEAEEVGPEKARPHLAKAITIALWRLELYPPKTPKPAKLPEPRNCSSCKHWRHDREVPVYGDCTLAPPMKDESGKKVFLRQPYMLWSCDGWESGV